MCGITGKTGETEAGLIEAMTNVISHRGPDSAGTYLEKNIALGHRRLKILDLSSAGAQPMSSSDARYTIVHNGEVYNFKDIRKELEAKGISFSSQTDTEVILQAYISWGVECLQKFIGMFAFAIWDKEEQVLFLARDRIGIKPLYTTKLPDGNIAFASEIKSLLKIDGVKAELDPAGLASYLTFLYLPNDTCIYKGIQKLLPGHYLLWKSGNTTTESYWDHRKTRDVPTDENEIITECQRLLEDSVKQRLVSDVPLGCFLSGGIDSSAITALMAKNSDQAVKTFTIGFNKEASSYDERDYAKLIADTFKTEHTEIEISPNLLDILPRAVEHFDEPFGNPTALLSYALSEETRKHVTVALAGDGGDEVFGGYPRYQGMALGERFNWIPKFLFKMASPLVRCIPESTSGKHLPRRLKEFCLGMAQADDERYLNWINYYSTEMLKQVFSPEFLERLNLENNKPDAAFLKEFNKDRGSAYFKARGVDLKTFLPDNVLAYGDRMSMAHALEVRVPLIDHRLIEFMNSLPIEYHLGDQGAKTLLKKAMQGILPNSILKRKKLGFNPPMGIWLQKSLKPLLDDCLSEDALLKRKLFNPSYVKHLQVMHQSGKRDFSLQIYALLNFEVWARRYL